MAPPVKAKERPTLSDVGVGRLGLADLLAQPVGQFGGRRGRRLGRSRGTGASSGGTCEGFVGSLLYLDRFTEWTSYHNSRGMQAKKGACSVDERPEAVRVGKA